MSLDRCRPVKIGRIGIKLACDTAEVRRRIDSLFEALPDLPGTAVEGPDFWRSFDLFVTSCRYAERGEPRFDLGTGNRSIVEGVPLWRIEDVLLEHVNRWLLDFDGRSVHLHGALISRDGQGLVLTGDSGSGKSTLAAALVASGWRYHSDETVQVDPGGRDLIAYPRPLTLKRGSWKLFQALPSVPACDAPADRMRAHIPPGELGEATSDPVRARLILFTTHDGTPGTEPCSPPQVAEALVANSLDLGRAHLNGYRALARLSRNAVGMHLRTGDLDATVQLVESLMADAADSAPQAALGEVVDVVDGIHDRLRRRGHGFDFGPDGGLIIDTVTGRVLRVNAAGFEAWSQLGDDSSTTAEVDSDADDGAFVADLIESGFAEISP